MTISHPSQLFSFLRKENVSPFRALSQNFLIDANIVRNIVRFAKIQKGDRVLEIGPGPGALTQELLRQGAEVVAIEKDPRFAQNLSRLGNVAIYEADILKFPFEKLLPHAPMKIVANLPYHLTSPILGKLCSSHALFSNAFLMVQREVANKMIAREKTGEMGPLALFLQIYSEPSLAIKWISRHCFWPSPQVDSSVVQLQFYQQPLLADPEPFLSWIRKAFQQRRKMLRSSLSIQQELYATSRPEELSLQEWLTLWNQIGS